MKIALVSPAWAQKNDYQPLGLGYLASVLEKEGHQTWIYDFTLRKNRDHHCLAQELVRHQPHIVGLTVTTNTYSSSLALVTALKKIMPCVKVVVGGPHPSLYPEEMAKNEGIDFAVFGEGEHTLLELVQALACGGGFSHIRGLAWKSAPGQVVRNQPRPAQSDLDALPFPVRSVVGSAGYPYRHSSSGRSLATILSSRGCPFNCSYCYKGIFGATYRQRSVENILQEIKLLKEEYGITFFYFIDDLFIFDHARIFELCRRIKQEEPGIEWQCLGRVDLVSPDLLRAMGEAGCRQVFYGIESGNPEVIRKTKNVTLEQVRLAVAWAKEAGIRVCGYFMLGLPDDTLETMRQTLDFSSTLGLEEAMFSIATPFPGTGLWEKLLRQGGGGESASFDYLFYHGDPRKVRYNVSNASEKEVLAMYRKARRLCAQIRDRAILTKKFGNKLGNILLVVSAVPGLRAAGRAVYRKFFCRFRHTTGAA